MITTRLMSVAAAGTRIFSNTKTKGLMSGLRSVHGHERHDDQQGADVENKNAQGDAVRGFQAEPPRDFRLRRLSRRSTLRPGKRRSPFGSVQQDPEDTERQDRTERRTRGTKGVENPAVGPSSPTWKKITTRPPRIRPTSGHHLDEREPELEFAEDTHGQGWFTPYRATSATSAGSHCGKFGNQ